MARRDRAIKVQDRVLAGLERVAKRDGTTVEELAGKWLQEKLDDDMRRRLLEAAGSRERDQSLIIDKACSVTMFDMHVQLTSDSRKRGLWIWLKDQSPDRAGQHQMLLDLEKRGLHRFDGTVSEAALLEWPTARAFHAATGKAIKDRR